MRLKVLLLAFFRCSLACPSGYLDQGGSVPVSEHFGSAATRATIDECRDDCDTYEDCLSFEYSNSSLLCYLSVLSLPTSWSSASDFMLCSKDIYLGYAAVNLMASNSSFRVNASGVVMPLGDIAVGTVQIFPGPVSVIGQRSDGLVAEWVNMVLWGREFVWQVMNSGLHRFTVFALEDSHVTVTFYGMMTYTADVVGGTALLLASTGARQVDVLSTGYILLAADSAPVPPAAETIFGQCSTECHISVFGGDNTVQLTRSCTNGTTDTVPPGRYWQGGADYSGDTCRWSAPSGYKISGHADEDGNGTEGSSFQAPEHFQLVTPLPDLTAFASFFSDQSALCTHSTDGSTFTLAGSSGVYHARVPTPQASTVITCDAPVTAVVGLSDCSSLPLDFPCSNKVLNLITAVAFTTTTTTTTTSSTTTLSNTTTVTTTSSTSSTNTTSTLTTSSFTSTATSNTSTTTNTSTATTTSSMTSTATTATTTVTNVTATATNTTTFSSTTCTATNTTTNSLTTTTATVSNTATTATLTTSSNTTTASTTSASTSTTSTLTRTTSTSTASTATTLTATASTSTASTSTATTSTASTATDTTSTVSATTTTATTPTTTISTTTATASNTSSSTSSSATTSSSTTSTATSSTTSATASPITDSATTSSTASSTTGTLAVAALSTTITTSTTTSLLAPSQVVQEVEEVESSVLAKILAGNETTSTIVVDGYTVVGTLLNSSAIAPGRENVTVTVPGAEGAEVKVTVPASAFDELGTEGLVLLVSSIDLSNASSLSDSVGQEKEILSAVNVNLFTTDGVLLDVSWLGQPIEIILPAIWNTSMQCAYWDELNQRWGSDGVFTSPSADGLVRCRTSHLTLFAAILRGFTNTFVCSKLALLSADGVAELATSGWYSTAAAQGFWALLTAFVLLLLWAAALDVARWRTGAWTDEHFLVSSEESPELVKSTTTASERAAGCLWTCLCWAKESSAIRDALDDVLSNWLSNFGEFRSFIEGLWEGLDVNDCCCGWSNAVYVVMCAMLAHAARRQAAATLGISKDAAMFVLEDEDANEFLISHHGKNKERRNSRDITAETEENTNMALKGNIVQGKVQGNAPSKPKVPINPTEKVGTLHTSLGEHMEAYLHRSAKWRSLPCTVGRLFLYGNPFRTAFVHCIFYSSSLRMMFFMVDIFGALMLAALFFQSAGGLVSKRSRFSGCKADSGSSSKVAENIGRLLAVGMTSMVVASLPSILLQALCTRGVKRFAYKGCPAWNRQLRVWRTQDKIAWTIATLYVGFCTFFITLFLANVVPADQSGWTISGAVSLAQDIVIIPLSVALCIPLLGLVCLSLASCMKKMQKQELVQESHMKLQKNHANLTLPLVYI